MSTEAEPTMKDMMLDLESYLGQEIRDLYHPIPVVERVEEVVRSVHYELFRRANESGGGLSSSEFMNLNEAIEGLKDEVITLQKQMDVVDERANDVEIYLAELAEIEE